MSLPDPSAIFLDEPNLKDGITRFYFIRHAVVEKSWRSRMYGSIDVELCPDTLKKQATAYRSLSKLLPENALLFASPLKRALDTAKAIYKHHHKGKALPKITIIDDLQEQNLGKWGGLEHQEFLKTVKMPSHPFWGMHESERPPEGESMDDLKVRVGAVMDRLASEHPQTNMVCVSHGGAIRMALAHALDIPAGKALSFSIQNLSCTIIEKIGPSYRVVNVNRLPDFD